MKAVQLPVNVLVILVICIIVLLGVMALFLSGQVSFGDTVGLQIVKDNACKRLRDTGCTANLDQIAVSGVGGVANLKELCEEKYFITDDKTCREMCLCGDKAGSQGLVGGVCSESGITPCQDPKNDCPPPSLKCSWVCRYNRYAEGECFSVG